MSARDDLKEILDDIMCPFGNSHEAQKRRIFEFFKGLKAASQPQEKIVTVTTRDMEEENRLREQNRVLLQKLQQSEARITQLEAKVAEKPKQEIPKTWDWLERLRPVGKPKSAAQRRGRSKIEQHQAFTHGMLVGSGMFIEGSLVTDDLDSVIQGFYRIWLKIVYDQFGRTAGAKWAADCLSQFLSQIRKFSMYGDRTSARIAAALGKECAAGNDEAIKAAVNVLGLSPEETMKALSKILKNAGFQVQMNPNNQNTPGPGD